MGETVRKPAAVLIAGPTASGKTGLAVALARQVDGAVINADSMQVYRELRVLTARPSAYEQGGVPHYLFGHVPAGEAYSVGRWLADATAALAAVRQRGAVPIFTGGTGLYFKALTEGLAQVPAIDPDLRAELRDLARRDPAALYQRLTKADPEAAAQLVPSDRQRVVRALEVVEGTGRPLAEWQTENAGSPLIDAGAARLLLLPPRGELHRRIEHRFAAMMAAGARGEVRRLLALRLDTDLPAMRAIGVARLAAVERGQATEAEAVERIIAATRQLAKRQTTWFRHQFGPQWRVYQSAEDAIKNFSAETSVP